jgi:uncharacterized protein YecE (DUF72 family)
VRAAEEMVLGKIRVGTAGWSIPREVAGQFPGEGAHLERYGQVMDCAEINSCFYRPHRRATYERWAAAVPEAFRFSAKVPKAITHESGLAPERETVRRFLEEVGGLEERLGPLLMQLPPKQGFAREQARAFLGLMREMWPEGGLVLEARNTGWFTAEAEAVLREARVSTVIADPPKGGATAGEGKMAPGEMVYYRLHGSPRVYYSSYDDDRLSRLAKRMVEQAKAAEVWCLFDNTASGAALANALTLMRMLGV